MLTTRQKAADKFLRDETKRLKRERAKLPARVLIEVRGGVAEYTTQGIVEVELVDYDNDPDAAIPEGFAF